MKRLSAPRDLCLLVWLSIQEHPLLVPWEWEKGNVVKVLQRQTLWVGREAEKVKLASKLA